MNILTSFMKQFYAGTPFIPKELLIQEEIEDLDVITAWLCEKRGSKVWLRFPKKGTKEKSTDMSENLR